MKQPKRDSVVPRMTRQLPGAGGFSQGNRRAGFSPAFLDTATGRIYASCFADGRPAPMHFLEGLPEELVRARDALGRVCSLKESVVAGFVRGPDFFTREQAALAIE